MAKTKTPAAQTNEPSTTNQTEKKRSRTKSEYVIERKIIHGNEGAWESLYGTYKDTASALNYMRNALESGLPDAKPAIEAGDYRIVVVKWAKTVKAEQKTVIKFE